MLGDLCEQDAQRGLLSSGIISIEDSARRIAKFNSRSSIIISSVQQYYCNTIISQIYLSLFILGECINESPPTCLMVMVMNSHSHILLKWTFGDKFVVLNPEELLGAA